MWRGSLLMICLAFKASASQIKGKGDTSADYGSQAEYKCKLDDPKDVLQVTWQRLYEDNSIENLATYSKRFGEQVNNPYVGKVVFTEASLHSTSITVKNLTWTDESCYVCSFNAYPRGSKRHQTCLKVQGVSEVKTQVSAPIDDAKEKNIKVIFSCTATGKPAPKIQWEYSHHVSVVEQSETSVSINDDHTLTSSRNITLQASLDWDGHVHCVTNPGMRGEKRETVIFTRKTEQTENDTFFIPIIVVTIIITTTAFLCIIVALLFWRKRLRLPTSLPTRCEENIL